MQAALSTGCTVVHPGYGFLSERPSFARLCADNGLTFVGPDPSALEALGDKLRARDWPSPWACRSRRAARPPT